MSHDRYVIKTSEPSGVTINKSEVDTASNSFTSKPSTNKTSWWFWNSSQQESPQKPKLTEEYSQIQETNNGIWATTYKQLSGFYKADLDGSQELPFNERQKSTSESVTSEGNSNSMFNQKCTKNYNKNRINTISIDASNLSDNEEEDESLNEPNSSMSWWNWIWSSNADSDTSSTSKVDLLEQAKSTIESNRSSLHYAFKSNDKYPYGELAVANTKTERNPISFKPRKIPWLLDQVQENSLHKLFKKSSQALNQSINSTSMASSSNTSLSSAASNVSSSSSSLSYNTVVPQIDENFRTITLVTKIRIISENILFKSIPENHIYKTDNLQKRKLSTKKIVVISVHGFYPFKMVKTLIGESTGSSMKFTSEATKAIKDWLEPNEPYNIETISLEGKGTIKNTVKYLYSLLMNWKELITECDFLLVVGNSQGSAVAANILAKLLEDNYLKKVSKIGFLSMSGIWNGPFIGLDTKIVIRAYNNQENALISEIFELSKPNSITSTTLENSLKVLIHHNVKITLSGSLNDQFVPLYSSLNLRISHPNIFRCVTVPEEIPSFIVILIKICLTLLNLGHSDYGVLGELSKYCQGTSGKGGHSQTYLNQQIYRLAITHGLETTTLKRSREMESNLIIAENIYTLPWKVRELIEDLVHTKHISNLTLMEELLKEYDNWEPTSKHWKEIKYALEGLSQIDLEEFLQ